MKLFFDENFGKGVPEAIRQVCPSRGISVDYVGRTNKAKRRAQKLGATDEQWITHVGRSGALGISCDKKILENEEERFVIRTEKAGIVFVTTGSEDSVKLLLLLLKELDWLRKIDEEVARPFAFTLNLSRQKRQVLGEIADLTEWKNRRSIKVH